MIFDAYSRYYDLLYSDKSYEAETKYVIDLIKEFATGAGSVLELGCGSGKHGQLLANAGYDVLGIDSSESMVRAASQRGTPVNQSGGSIGSFLASHGDARTFSADRKFDAVVSLFHVISYQTTNTDLLSVFSNAARHLKPGGVFIFDVWYGPAVLKLRPETRIKRMQDEKTEIMRLAEPVIFLNDNVVVVDYTVMVTDKLSGSCEKVFESHKMRYLFRPELELIAEMNGLSIVHFEEWLTKLTPNDKTWGVTFIARRR